LKAVGGNGLSLAWNIWQQEAKHVRWGRCSDAHPAEPTSAGWGGCWRTKSRKANPDGFNLWPSGWVSFDGSGGERAQPAGGRDFLRQKSKILPPLNREARNERTSGTGDSLKNLNQWFFRRIEEKAKRYKQTHTRPSQCRAGVEYLAVASGCRLSLLRPGRRNSPGEHPPRSGWPSEPRPSAPSERQRPG